MFHIFLLVRFELLLYCVYFRLSRGWPHAGSGDNDWNSFHGQSLRHDVGQVWHHPCSYWAAEWWRTPGILLSNIQIYVSSVLNICKHKSPKILFWECNRGTQLCWHTTAKCLMCVLDFNHVRALGKLKTNEESVSSFEGQIVMFF